MDIEPESHTLITKVWAKNFRSIEFAEMKLSPLTVLVGPNASGKSNLVDVLRFVADSVRNGLDAAITDRGGINSIGRRSSRGRAYDPEVGLRVEDDESIIEYGFAIENRGRGKYGVKREYARWKPKKEVGKPLKIEIRNGCLTIPKGILKNFQFDQTDLELPSGEPWFLLSMQEGEADEGNFTNMIQALSTFEDHAREMHFYQIFPNVLRDPQKMSYSYHLFDRGQNLASVLRDMIQRKSLFLPELKQALGYVVPGVRDIKVTQAGNFLVVELNHEDAAKDGRKAWFDLSLESDGTLRLLGLLAALLQDPPPSLIAIEEPELTIHPGAMGVLADIMKEATLRTQVLVTTHSPDLIDRLPIESIRAVTAEGGSTKAGMVTEEQREAVKRGLFSPGELHRMEGLQVASKEN